MPQLFVVLLGGEVDGCNIEMHDIRFAVGETIEDCYPQLRDQWVGSPESLHIDAYLVLQYVDGFEIRLAETKSSTDKRLYFVNTGGYDAEHFAENHEICFYVAHSAAEAKKRALDELLLGKAIRHKDDLYDIDDCLALSKIETWHVQLVPTDKTQAIKPDWFGYNTDVC